MSAARGRGAVLPQGAGRARRGRIRSATKRNFSVVEENDGVGIRHAKALAVSQQREDELIHDFQKSWPFWHVGDEEHTCA